MLLFPVAVVAGVVLGLVLGGTPGAVASLRLRHTWLVVLALSLQLFLGLDPARHSDDPSRFGLVVVSYVLVGAWLGLNCLSRPPALRVAIALVALGWLLNLAVMLPNQGMPVSSAAVDRIGVERGDVRNGQLWKHVEASSDTTLRPLGDVVPVPLPGLRSVISAGDIVMLAGVAFGLAAAMRPPARRLSPAPAWL